MKEIKLPSDTIYCFLDTNIFIHFRLFDQIDWTEVLGSHSVCLVLSSTVMGELSSHKDDNRHPWRQTHARAILAKLKQYLPKTTTGYPVQVSKNVTLLDIVKEPLVDWATLELDPLVKDDRLLADILTFKESLSKEGILADVRFISDDFAAQRKAIYRGINLVEMPEKYRLEPSSPEAARIRQLEQENQELKKRRPDLRLSFYEKNENMTRVVRSIKEPRSKSFSDEEREQFARIHAGKLFGEKSKYFISQWTTNFSEAILIEFIAEQRKILAQTIGEARKRKISDEEIHEYLMKYEWYLRNLEFGVPYHFIFVIENIGLLPVTDIEVAFIFPNGSFAADAGKTKYSLEPAIFPLLLKESKGVEVPESTPEEYFITAVTDYRQIEDFHIIHYRTKKLSKGARWSIPVLAHVPNDGKKGFAINYSIVADELFQKIEGVLHVTLEE